MNRFKFYSLVITIFAPIIIFINCAKSSGQTAKQIANEAFDSTVLLVMEDSNGQPSSLGSGFFVSEGIIATNLHVIKNASRGYARIVGRETKYNVDGIVGLNSKRDLALLKISIEKSTPLKLGDSNTTQVGETVYAVGNPQGLEGTFSKGIISGIRSIDSDKLIQLTAPISPGSSGGPVLNSEGEVVGISVATFRNGQNLNFAIPVNYLKKLLNNRSSLKTLSDLDKQKPQKSIVSKLGERNTKGVVGQQFVWGSYVEYNDWSSMPFDAYNGEFTISLRNKFREPIKNVLCLIVFYDSNDQPLDVTLIRYNEIIPGGLAERISAETDRSVQKLTTPERSARPKTKVEYRILDFDIAK